MKIDIIPLFPEVIDTYMKTSVLGRAGRRGAVVVRSHDLRDYSLDKHGRVDNKPYGGGAGMVLQIEPIYRALRALKENSSHSRVILLSAKGETFNQDKARELASEEHLILICGRYEGVDERVALYLADEELSIGDFVLTGGELPALAVADAVARLLPGVLGNSESAQKESHSPLGTLEYPHYTTPADFRGMKVPPVLLSGDHRRINAWRRRHAKKRDCSKK